MYTVSTPPSTEDLREYKQYVDQELQQISGALALLFGGNVLETRNVAPTKPRAGMLALADGVNWNPGGGAGVYCYYGAAWHLLG